VYQTYFKCTPKQYKFSRRSKGQFRKTQNVIVTYALFDNVFTIPDYVASRCGMTDEWWIGMDLGGIDFGLIEMLSWGFTAGTKNPSPPQKKTQSRQLVSRYEFDTASGNMSMTWGHYPTTKKRMSRTKKSNNRLRD
jgi:hypothetical protein